MKVEQVQALWDHARGVWGTVDIWINNAGASGSEAMVWDLPPEEASAVIDTNILGTIYGCQIAVRGMLDQGVGAIYNMEGMGSDGRMHAGLTTYGTSKYAVSYFSRALAKELTDHPILIGSLRPGMVVTTFLTDQYRDRPEDFERAALLDGALQQTRPLHRPLKNTYCISYLPDKSVRFRQIPALATRQELDR
jgi:NAD(P)-dependent dehydrogenase (short-subunit alcohol dehydrogenase family)